MKTDDRRIIELLEAIATRVATPPLLGRAGVFAEAKEFQMFAAVRNDALAIITPVEGALVQGPGWYANYLPQTADGPCKDGLPPYRHRCERLWMVSTAAQSVWRESVNADLTPLTPAQFDSFETFGSTPPAGALMGGNGWFRLKVKVNDNTGNRVFLMDLDEKVELYGYSVQAELVGPPGAILIAPTVNDSQAATPAALRGTVIDLRVGASIQPIESPVGLWSTRSTQLVVVPINTSASVSVPRFARAVKIYQSTAGAAAGPWQRVVGPGAFNVGVINFAARHSVDEDAELGRESTLLSDVDAASDRVFVVQWTIVP